MSSFKNSNARWLVAPVAASLLLGIAWTKSPASKDAYSNGHLGFSMTPPSFAVGPDVPVASLATFYAPPANKFADNLGVQLHRTPFEQFCKQSDLQFEGGAFTLVSSKELKLGSAAAREYRYRGKANGFDLEFLGVAVASGNDTYLLTGTALASDFARMEPVFRAAIESFRLDK